VIVHVQRTVWRRGARDEVRVNNKMDAENRKSVASKKRCYAIPALRWAFLLGDQERGSRERGPVRCYAIPALRAEVVEQLRFERLLHRHTFRNPEAHTEYDVRALLDFVNETELFELFPAQYWGWPEALDQMADRVIDHEYNFTWRREPRESYGRPRPQDCRIWMDLLRTYDVPPLKIGRSVARWLPLSWQQAMDQRLGDLVEEFLPTRDTVGEGEATRRFYKGLRSAVIHLLWQRNQLAIIYGTAILFITLTMGLLLRN